MAYSAADLGADELTRAAADKPILSSNALISGAVAEKWVVGSTAGNGASPQQEDTDFPADRVLDDLPGYVSKPNGASTTFTLFINCFGNGLTFDWFGLMNHNLHTLTCTDLTLQIANDSAFSSGVLGISTTNVSTSHTADRRIADMVLESGGGTARRYSNVEYLRLQITCASGIPEIGQVVLGRRRQQKYNPQLQWGPSDQSSNISRTITRGGVHYKNVWFKGRRDIAATLLHDESDLQDDLIYWWADIEAGEQNCFWHDAPNTSPDDFVMFDLDEPEFRYPYIDWQTRQFEFVASEQGPDAEFFSQGP